MEKIKSLDLFTKGEIDFGGFKIEKDKINVISSGINEGKNIISRIIANEIKKNDENNEIVVCSIGYNATDKKDKRVMNIRDDLYAMDRFEKNGIVNIDKKIVYILEDVYEIEMICELAYLIDKMVAYNVCVIITTNNLAQDGIKGIMNELDKRDGFGVSDYLKKLRNIYEKTINDIVLKREKNTNYLLINGNRYIINDFHLRKVEDKKIENTLIMSKAGGGKTTKLKELYRRALLNNNDVEVYMIDIKQCKELEEEERRFCKYKYQKIKEIKEVIKKWNNEINDRILKIQENDKISEYKIICIEEYPCLLKELETKDKELKEDLIYVIKKICEMSDEIGIYVYLTTHRLLHIDNEVYGTMKQIILGEHYEANNS